MDVDHGDRTANHLDPSLHVSFSLHEDEINFLHQSYTTTSYGATNTEGSGTLGFDDSLPFLSILPGRYHRTAEAAATIDDINEGSYTENSAYLYTDSMLEAAFLRLGEQPDVVVGAGGTRSVTGSVRTSASGVVHLDQGLPWTATTLLVINYISAGYILVPRAFAVGGTLLTSAVLAAICLLGYVTAAFILETCARAETYVAVKNDDSNNSSNSNNSTNEFVRRASVRIRNRKYELSLLSRLFLGKFWSLFFTITAACDLYGITWAYCTIFASAFANMHPIWGESDNEEETKKRKDLDYAIYVVIFMAIAVPSSCGSVVDQIRVQLAFLAARMLMFLLMAGSLAIAYIRPDQSYFDSQLGPAMETPLADASNVLVVIQTIVFALSFQHCVPTVAGTSRNKYTLTSIFQYSLSFIYVTNAVLGVLVATYFGDRTQSSNNLNWTNYHGGGESTHSASAMIGSITSTYILLFSALDCLAAFPLSVISLGDILMSAVFGEDVHDWEEHWWVRTAFRVVASTPQAIGALCIRNLSVLATYAGVFGLLSYTVLPSLLYISSEFKMESMDLPTRTSYYHYWFSSRKLAYALLVTAFTIIVAVFIQQTNLALRAL